MFHIEDIHYSYKLPDGVLLPAINGISLDIARGAWVTLIGGNGSGKSTFAQHLNGLIIPDSGEVSVNGSNTKIEATLPFIRRSVGYVMQNPDNQIIATSVEDDLAFGAENVGMSYEDMLINIPEILQLVGLVGFEKRNPTELSGGQKQRLAIGGALMLKPQAIILDEATSMLDPVGVAEVIALLQKLHAQGMTIITITHSPEEMLLADEAIVLQGGKVVRCGTPAEILQERENLAQWKVEMPMANVLGNYLSEAGFNAELAHVLNIDELVEKL